MGTLPNEIHDIITPDNLREDGLKYLQAMTGHIWTDYHAHDPGVTLLESLCYAITDLELRLSRNIEDILAHESDNEALNQFFSPGEILTVNPVTLNDYRKLLIDIEGVRNAWLIPAKSDRDLYYDKDNNALLYDYTRGSKRLSLNGLYRVLIEKHEDVENEEALKAEIKARIHEHRNMGEDFLDISIMEHQTISLFTDIQIAQEADEHEVMAEIYLALREFISPEIKQYSLKRMLQKGKRIEEIFNGPQLTNGFIDDDELGSGKTRKELHTSDLIRIIMSHPHVKDVRKLFIANKPEPTPLEKKEWALVLDETKALLLEDFNSSKIRLFKNETMCPINVSRVRSRVDYLAEEAKREIFDDPAMDIRVKNGTYNNLTVYNSLAETLPVTYGVGETGLSSTADDTRRAQARQLKGYLLFFEQMLVNYFKQLDSFKHLFAVRQNQEAILKNYFSQLLPDHLWRDDFPEIIDAYQYDENEVSVYTADGDNAFKQKNRILNHLLAQFNEKFSEYALFGYTLLVNTPTHDKQLNFLKAKSTFLAEYPELSRNRNRAYNYLSDTPNSSGLKNLIGSKLGLDMHHEQSGLTTERDTFHVVEHILLRPEGDGTLDFICSEKIADAYQPDPYSYNVTFVIPKRGGRFDNGKFKDLVYATIEAEIPAHLSYSILELDKGRMEEFTTAYHNFLTQLKQNDALVSRHYNPHRNTLVEMLGLGRIKLPVLHLDAGDETIGIGPVTTWTDQSRNNNDALSDTVTKPTALKQNGNTFIRFENDAQFVIEKPEGQSPIITDDFSLVVVYRGESSGPDTGPYPLITGTQSTQPNITLTLSDNGAIAAAIDTKRVKLDSTLMLPHMAILTRDKSSGAVNLYLDGVLQRSATLDSCTLSFDQTSIMIGPGKTGMICDIGEVIIMDSVLTGTARKKLEDYLSAKWQIALSAVGSIAEPMVHLDAGNIRSVERDETQKHVIRWNDYSGHDMHGLQDKTDLQPDYHVEGVNGLPGIYFNTRELVLAGSAGQMPAPAGFTIAMIYKAYDTGGNLLSCTLGSQSPFSVSTGNKGRITASAGENHTKIVTDPDQAHMVIINGSISGTTLDVSLHIDGKSSASGTFTLPANPTLDPVDLVLGQNGFNGYISELVIYNEVISLIDRQYLEEFLSDKWRIDISGINPVATPMVHLDASRRTLVQDAAGDVVDDGGRVAHWHDRSFFMNHAQQDNAYRRPLYTYEAINNLGAIHFSQEKTGSTDDYEDYLTLDRIIKDDFTIMAVFKPDVDLSLIPAVAENDQWTAGAALIDADCSGKYNDFGLSLGIRDGKLVVMAGVGDRLTEDHTMKSGELDDTVPHFITFTRERSTGKTALYVDGLLHADADLRNNVVLNAARKIRIGGFNSEGVPFHGHIGEVVILNSIPGDEQRRLIEKYLSQKWQIPLTSLPIDTNGLQLHLDATDTRSLTRNAVNQVSSWSDVDDQSVAMAMQSDVKHQPVYVEQGVNNLPALRFNTSFMTVTGDTGAPVDYADFTIAVVYQAATAGNITTDASWDYGAGLIDGYDGGSNATYGLSIARDGALTARIETETLDHPAAMQVPHIAMVTRRGSDGALTLYVDGIVQASGTDPISGTSLPTVESLTLGAIHMAGADTVSKGYFHGEIAEVVVFDRVLGVDDRQGLERFLSMKWHIDISGMTHISKPVLHLDASRVATVVEGAAPGRVAKWRDINSHNNNAIQERADMQPVYRSNAYNGLGVIHFENNPGYCLTLPRVIQDDFTVIIVYQTDNDFNSGECMPVSKDAFVRISGVDTLLSETLWNNLISSGMIDADGNVTASFTPAASDFTLGLTTIDGLKASLQAEIVTILSDEYKAYMRQVPHDAFVKIDGVNETLSRLIWDDLVLHGYLTAYGDFTETFDPAIVTLTMERIVEAAVIDVLLTDNWIEGMGLFDANRAGSRSTVNKRDFGMLIGKQGELIAGIGVTDDKDYSISTASTTGLLHLGILTRDKESGDLILSVDGVETTSRFARNISIRDSKTMTIGAVNTGGNYFKGDIAEIIVFDTVPTIGELTEVKAYLAHKWGISLSI